MAFGVVWTETRAYPESSAGLSPTGRVATEDVSGAETQTHWCTKCTGMDHSGLEGRSVVEETVVRQVRRGREGRWDLRVSRDLSDPHLCRNSDSCVLWNPRHTTPGPSSPSARPSPAPGLPGVTVNLLSNLDREFDPYVHQNLGCMFKLS